MEPKIAYNVSKASKPSETQENIAYNVNERSPTQTDEDPEYSIIENNEREIYTTDAGEKQINPITTVFWTTKATQKKRQDLANDCAKKWLAILAIIAFVLALLVAVAALVYTNIELKNHNSKQNNIFRNLNDVQSILEELVYLGTINNPASSCSDIPQDRPSGYYWIMTTTSSPVQVYCDMNRTSCSCNTAGGWMRVANLDMTDPNQNCPAGFNLTTRTEPPLRTCGRTELIGCLSTSYSTYGVEYSKVCGRIIAYQRGSSDAFRTYFDNNTTVSIDDGYVDGVSLTHGQSPRQHIWTFANGIDETRFDADACPCSIPDRYTGAVPPFIGQDYFCESGSQEPFMPDVFFSNDSLWDGQGCGSNSICCEFNNPQWFCKQLPQPTTDNIELRLCANEGISNEDTPIEIIDMYIQ